MSKKSTWSALSELYSQVQRDLAFAAARFPQQYDILFPAIIFSNGCAILPAP
jgi:hypothetical protein